MRQQQEHDRPQQGILATIADGFDLTTKHIWLTLIPIALDLFLWLGPRLSLRPLLTQLVTLWQQEPLLTDMAEQFLTLAPRTNLFTSLSVPLVGVPVLMAGITPEKTPLLPQVIELTHNGQVGGLFFAFTLAGLGLTAVFLTLVSFVVQQTQPQPDETHLSGLAWGGRILHVWVRLVGLVLSFLFLMLLLYLPLAIVGGLVSLLSPLLSMLVFMLGPMVGIWLVMTGYFIPQGLALDGRSLSLSMRSSLQIIRSHAQTAFGLMLAVLLIGGIVDQFLLLMEDGSWITLVAILTHAFVCTALVTATFLFYQHRK